jgi:hypothetical protein
MLFVIGAIVVNAYMALLPGRYRSAAGYNALPRMQLVTNVSNAIDVRTHHSVKHKSAEA